jgi:hypothetical protein
MKKKYFFILLFCVSLSAISQTNDQKNSASITVDPRIIEVYANQLDVLVLSDNQRLNDLNDILLKRTEIVVEKYRQDEKFLKLFSMPLFNKYNINLKKDTVFTVETFNVLKYNLEFFSKFDKVYRIDNTDFILIIHPQTFNK